jgi:transcriptional regulator with PAS, ATPase and Fis domain
MIQEQQFREDLFFRLNVFPITVPSLEERLEDLPLLLDHFINNVFKKKYKYEEKQVGPDVIEILSQQSWQGNIRQLEHTIERAILFSGKSNTLKPEHFQFDFKQEAKAPVKKDAPMEVTTLAEMEKRLIYAALKKANDHRNKAAEMLDISVRTLRNKLAQYENEDGAAD